MNAKHWITVPVDTEGAAVEFRRTFNLEGKVESATMHVSAIGVYALYLM